jgi:hypothetical protein
MADTVRAWFDRRSSDWQLPKSGCLFSGPTGVYIIVTSRRCGTWNEMKNSLGAVQWQVGVLKPSGGYISMMVENLDGSYYMVGEY